MKRVLVTGGGGFIGTHLVRSLRASGYDVTSTDLHPPRWVDASHKFICADLRNVDETRALMERGSFDEVYHLAANMGGMGFIHSHERELVMDNIRMNTNVLMAVEHSRVPRLFFSSSVCVYRDMEIGESPLFEDDAYPANPDNEYGWEKLFTERMALMLARHSETQVRIARFQNCYGEWSEFEGGREKAPAALCRKTVLAKNGTQIEVWGDGTAVRSYTYVSDLVRGIRILMDSDERRPANIGSAEYFSVDELAGRIIRISGKNLSIRHVPGEVGVRSRNFSNSRMEALGWRGQVTPDVGLEHLYAWVRQEIENGTSDSGNVV